jgi:hypothetical protein
LEFLSVDKWVYCLQNILLGFSCINNNEKSRRQKKKKKERKKKRKNLHNAMYLSREPVFADSARTMTAHVTVE